MTLSPQDLDDARRALESMPSDPSAPLPDEFRCLGSGALTPFERLQYDWHGTVFDMEDDDIDAV